MSFSLKINGEVLLYFPRALAWFLVEFSTRYSRICHIDISLDVDITLYSDLHVTILTNKNVFFCFFVVFFKTKLAKVQLFTTMILLWV